LWFVRARKGKGREEKRERGKELEGVEVVEGVEE
jgi:hypothetical protein